MENSSFPQSTDHSACMVNGMVVINQILLLCNILHACACERSNGVKVLGLFVVSILNVKPTLPGGMSALRLALSRFSWKAMSAVARNSQRLVAPAGKYFFE